MSDLGLSAVKAYGGVAQTIGGMAGGKESGGIEGPDFGRCSTLQLAPSAAPAMRPKLQ